MAGLFSSFKTLTLNDLINIDPGRLDRSNYLLPQFDKVYHVVKKETLWERVRRFFLRKDNYTINMYYLVFAYNVSSPNGAVHRVFIEIQPNSNRSSFFDNVAKVYCDCADFKYRFAWLLNKRGNLFKNKRIELELGIALQQEPTEKTKLRSSGSHICKHCYAAVNHLASNYDQIVANI